MNEAIQTRRYLACALLIAIAGPVQAQAEDWTQWRGQERLGIWHDTGIIDEFPDEGLEISWRVPIGSGYSGPVVSNGRVVTMDYEPKAGTKRAEAIERVICLDESTGELLWENKWETHYRDMMGSYRTGPTRHAHDRRRPGLCIGRGRSYPLPGPYVGGAALVERLPKEV